jgi:hypothetical protein
MLFDIPNFLFGIQAFFVAHCGPNRQMAMIRQHRAFGKPDEPDRLIGQDAVARRG